MVTLMLIVLGLIVARLAGTLVLSALNRSQIRRAAKAPPAGALAIMDAETFSKAASYTLERSLFGSLVEVFDAFILGVVLFGGFLPWLYWRIGNWGDPGSAWVGATYIVVAMSVISAISLPFGWWEQFRIEARYGFNRSSPGLWLADRAKGFVLSVVLGFPLLWALLALVSWAGDSWWIWGFALIFVVQIVMMLVYPTLILPLFNTLSPLPEGELRTRLLALGERTQFKANAIHIMDGSKRSAHSNAFFTGFGRFRRIVLYDTLVAQLTTEELEAVLAHEIGHYRKGHIPKAIALSAGGLLLGLYLAGVLARTPWFNLGFGLPAEETAPTFLLFGLTAGLVTFWVTPLGNALSRRNEYEADRFARDAMGGPAAMIGALRKLAQKNLSNLTPHPLFSAFYYSHPTLIEREEALRNAR